MTGNDEKSAGPSADCDQQDGTGPRIVDRRPVKLELQPGVYDWCRCGRSQTQPFCDGSHEGTGFEPVRFEVTETRNIRICLCKHSKNPPFCDGSHYGV